MIALIEGVFFAIASIVGLFALGRDVALVMFGIGLAFILLSYFERGWPSRVKHWLLSSYAKRQVSSEFSMVETDEWGIEIDMDHKVTASLAKKVIS